MTGVSTVLVVDDNEDALAATARLLERAGYEVARAVDGRQALQLTRALRPDLILLDVMLPDTSGLNVLREIRADSALAGISIVLFSSQATRPEQQVDGLDSGADGYIARPVSGDELLARVRALFRQRELTAQLRASEERFRATFEQAAVGMAHVGTDGRFVRVNNKLCDILGYQRDDLLGIAFVELTVPEDRASGADARADLLAGRIFSDRAEKRYLRKDGEPIWVDIVTTLERPASGPPKYFITVVEDITARKLAEQSLQKQAALLRIAGRAARLGGWTIDLPARTLTWSDETCAIHDLPPGHVLALDEGIGYFLPEDRPTVVAYVDACERDGTPYDFELPKITAKGRRIWVRSIGEAMRDDTGKIVRLQGAFQDISDRRRAEQVLREQASLLDKAQDAILVRDLDHRILFWNQSAERLYGWTAIEVMGRSVVEVLYRDQAPFLAAVAATLAAGEWVGELQQFARDGRALTVEGRWTLVRDEAGAAKSILAIHTDITLRQQLELQYLRAQRMESIGTLAGGIAHDLNNVLAPILMSIELLQDGERDQDRLEVLATIEASAKRGAAMVRQVLSFARGMEGSRVEVRLPHMVGDLVRIVRDTFPKSIQIDERVAPDLWAISADPTQIHQVLLNLCVNSRDAMPGGGRLAIRAENLMIEAADVAMNIEARVGPHVRIDVDDTGTGIPRNIIDKIFDPFFTTKPLGKGTGLGLATSLAIVKSHGGFIRMESEPGAGTKAHLYFPALVAPAAQQPPPAAESSLPRGRGETVLVVDDEDSIRQITRQALAAFGYRVLVASDGSEAVAIYGQRGSEIDVVLTDMMMPVMDGAATIQALRRLNPAVRIVGASGLTTDGQAPAEVRADIAHFLPKPYTAETLLKTIRAALDQ